MGTKPHIFKENIQGEDMTQTLSQGFQDNFLNETMTHGFKENF